MKTKKFLLVLFALLAVTISIGACANATPAAPGGLTITDVWARPSAMASGGMSMETPTSGGMDMSKMTSAVYMKINSGGTADKLVKAESAVAASTELHTVEMKEGVMQMRPVEGGIDVPAMGTLELKPGGFHIMLIGLQQPLKADDAFNVKLTFEKAGVKEVPVQVRSMQQ